MTYASVEIQNMSNRKRQPYSCVQQAQPLLASVLLLRFLRVCGVDKATILKKVLEGFFDPRRLPKRLIHPTYGPLLWLADQTPGQILKVR